MHKVATSGKSRLTTIKMEPALSHGEPRLRRPAFPSFLFKPLICSLLRFGFCFILALRSKCGLKAFPMGSGGRGGSASEGTAQRTYFSNDFT